MDNPENVDNLAILKGYISHIAHDTDRNSKPMVEITMFTHKDYIDKNGQPQRKATKHVILCYNRIAQNAINHAAIGHFIEVKGEIQHREYKDVTGERWVYNINANYIRVTPVKGRT